MISWIQRYFQKHFRLVFFVIILAVGLPMIVVYSQSSSALGHTGTKSLERPFFNVNIGNEEQSRRVILDGSLSAQLKAGYAALQGAQLQQYALQRIAGLAVADELHLPTPTADQVARYVPTLPIFQNEQGQFDQQRYTEFADAIKTGGQITTADVNRVLRDDVRLAALGNIISGPGYVLPYDIKQQLIRTDSTWTVQVASLDYATFNPAIAVTEDGLKKFYTDNIFRYEVPARPRLSYVEFKGTEFIPPVAPTEAELRAFYNANPGRFPLPAEAEAGPAATPSLTPAAPDNFPKVRAQVETALKESTGARGASQAANDLTIALFEHRAELPANSPALNTFLTGVRRPVKAIPPFAPDSPPADLPWLSSYADQIARLGPDRYFSDPLPTPDSFVVLLWQESLPAYTPLFGEVRERVTADYNEGEKRRLFIERGNALRTRLQAAAGEAGKFASVAATEKLEVKSFANFTLREPPQDMPYQAFGALAGLAPGQVSSMTADQDKGYFVFVQEKKLPPLNPDNPRYAELQNQLMSFTAGTNQNAYLADRVEQELKKTAPATP